MLSGSDAGGGNNSPMDLSVPAAAATGVSRLTAQQLGDGSDGSDSDGTATTATMTAVASQPSRGLSVVRPEILFGTQRQAAMERHQRQQQAGEDDDEEEDDMDAEETTTPSANLVTSSPLTSSSAAPAGGRPSPLSLLSTFAGMSGVLSPFFKSEDTTSNSMREAFREVLKLYGMSSEMADSIMQNSAPDSAKPAGKQEP